LGSQLGLEKKTASMSNLICYCFEYSVEDIKQDYIKNGRSLIVGRISAEKKFGNCQCATKNPKGE